MTRLVDWALRHPRRVALVSGVLLLLAAVGLTQLQTSAAVRTLVGTSSPGYQADRTVAKRFGDEAIVVLIRESARNITLTDDVDRVLALEACLGGKVPTSEALPGGKSGPCEQLRRLQPIHVVYGPGTFLSTTVGEVNAQIKQITANLGSQSTKQTQELLDLAQQYKISPSGVSVRDTAFVQQMLFEDPETKPGVPKARFSAVLPTPEAGLITLRLRADLSDADRRRAVDLVQQAVKVPDFALQHGGSYVVSGSPVLVEAVAEKLQRALLALLAVGVLVMAFVLAVSFPERRRLRPLGLALGTVGVVFGATGLLGVPINLGTIATLPVLLGLAVDYGVQLHARVEESRRTGLREREAVRDAVARGGRPVLLAAGATLAGFLALVTSPTPLVRGFALVLFCGVALAVFASFTLGLVLHARRPRRLPSTAETPRAGGRMRRILRIPGRVLRRIEDRLSVDSSPLGLASRGIGTGPGVRRLVSIAYRRPRAILAVGVVLAVVGVALGSREPVETDLQRLIPADLPALKDLKIVEQESGQSGEIQVLVEGKDLATPATLQWIDDYRDRVLKDARYDADRGCAEADLCPLSVPFATFLNRQPAKFADAAALSTALQAIPAYFVGATLTDDRTAALLSFGIRLGPLEHQRAVVQRMRKALDPPDGVRATVTGLPVLVSDASATISSPLRRLLTLLGSLVLVGGFLTIVARSWRRGLVPVLPVALAAGWSGLLLWLFGLPLNPLSVVLGALVVAIGTEFGVLLVERYAQERRAGHTEAVAIARTAASTGRAVGASAATTVAGFAVLAVSDIPLLRQFGLITVLDLLVAVLAVVLILPALAALGARRAEARSASVTPVPDGPGRGVSLTSGALPEGEG